MRAPVLVAKYDSSPGKVPWLESVNHAQTCRAARFTDSRLAARFTDSRLAQASGASRLAGARPWVVNRTRSEPDTSKLMRSAGRPFSPPAPIHVKPIIGRCHACPNRARPPNLNSHRYPFGGIRTGAAVSTAGYVWAPRHCAPRPALYTSMAVAP
jgi:hypothetical protein